MSTVIYRDLGLNFFGFMTRIADETVCVLTPRARTEVPVQALIRRAMGSQGRDCKTCLACPVGRAE